MTVKKYVAYYRVSTQKQGVSGLGLEAQKAIVRSTVQEGEIIREFVEVESGKHATRPELAQAIDVAKSTGASLVIAKLDRLSRDVNFIFSLRATGIQFVACDLPEFNTMTLAVFAGVAQHEREMISQRTKAALAIKKAQGYKLGNPQNLTQAARQIGYRLRGEKARAKEGNAKAWSVIQVLRSEGLSLHAVAKRLDLYGQKTINGKQHTACSVSNLIKLYKGIGVGHGQ